MNKIRTMSFHIITGHRFMCAFVMLLLMIVPNVYGSDEPEEEPSFNSLTHFGAVFELPSDQIGRDLIKAIYFDPEMFDTIDVTSIYRSITFYQKINPSGRTFKDQRYFEKAIEKDTSSFKMRNESLLKLLCVTNCQF